MTSENADVLGDIHESNNLTKAQREQIVKEGTGYEPSVPVKRAYLPLRKKDRLWGGVKYPGLFDNDPANDSGWFWFTVILEVISLATTYFLLQERISASVLLVCAVCLFGLDFTFAYFHHRYKGFECLILNQKRLFLPEMRPGVMGGPFANYVAHLEQRLKDNIDCKYLRYIFAFLIWVLSFFKGGVFFIAVLSSYWFQLAVSDSKTPYLLIFAIIASYFWIAYNHLKFTGYFMAAWSFKNKYEKESVEYNRKVGEQSNNNEKQYQEEIINFRSFKDIISADNTNPYLIHFSKRPKNDLEKDHNIGIKEIQVQAHGVKRNSQEHTYAIYRYGLLTDDQLQQMINVQETQLAQIAVAIYGHKLQMQSAHFNY
ncbi:MAG: hypothetical protein V2B20_25395 [Pseudomonadota bacterium]